MLSPREVVILLAAAFVPSGTPGNQEQPELSMPIPVILDVRGDGIALTTTEDGVLFDLYSTGRPTKTAWTMADGDDAFLVVDYNRNGRIDNGAELVGATPNGPPGLHELAINDRLLSEGKDQPENANGVIDVQDSIYKTLLLWTDVNHNGISETDELQSIAYAGITELRASYTAPKRPDGKGNTIYMKSEAFRMSATGVPQPLDIYGVVLSAQRPGRP